ncbi:MAG: class A beta-lactamase-related serine hydrolase [Comamonadaceae bacterium]|nr:MAG: class A beta-lactamase-related serine hydrolase [Comamonadaceae bacterium]
MTFVSSFTAADGPDAPAAAGPSRRASLGWAAASLAVPLLQACGGGSAGPGFWPAPPDAAEAESVRWCRDAIRAALARSNSTTTTAISVALFADDRVVWREAFGYADREREVAATADTRFNIGSVSKVVTALAVMILRDRGRLALDQPVAQLLPAFRMRSPAYTQVTVRHLLSHASGFPGNNMRNNGSFVPYLSYAQDTLNALTGQHLKHEPGEMAVYCNDGFTLVEPLVQALTGLSFPDFVQQEIFGPLGMALSGYPGAPAAEGSYVRPYYEGRSLTQEMSTPFASGGAFSTPADMLKLAQLFLNRGMHQGRQIVSAEAIREMGADQSARTRINPSAASWRWGLGWDTVQQAGLNAAGLQAWAKNGGTFFFSTEFFVLPEARLAAVITGSGHDYQPQVLMEGLLLRAAAERGVIRTLPPALVPTTPPPAPTAPDTTALTGVYASSKAPVQVLADAGGSLLLSRWNNEAHQWDDANAQHLHARSDGNWWPEGPSTVCYRFQTVLGHRYVIQRVLSANALWWGELPLGEWLPPLDTPLPAAWHARLGSQWRYTSDSPDSLVSRLLPPIVWRIDELPDLPGYVLLDGEQLMRVVNDHETAMTVKVPGNDGRDLLDLRMVVVDGREQLRLGHLVFEAVDEA